MAANTELSAAVSLPAVADLTGVGTTWQAFTLNTLRKSTGGKVTVVSSGAMYVAFASGGDVDGGAVSSPKLTYTAAQAAAGVSFELCGSAIQSAFILVAAQATTVDVELVQE